MTSFCQRFCTVAWFLGAIAAPAATACAQEDGGAAKVDLYGDPLPEGAVARFGTVRFLPRDDGWAIAISPDGTRIATGSFPGCLASRVEVFDAQSGKRTATLVDNTNNIISLAWSPDGKKLVVGHDYRCEVWAVDGKQLIGALDRPTDKNRGGLWSLRWSRDGRWIAAYEPHYGISLSHVWLWDAATRKVAHSEKYDAELHGLDFSPDSKRLAVCGQRLLEVRRVETFAVEVVAEDVEDKLCSVAFSPDGKTLAGGVVANDDSDDDSPTGAAGARREKNCVRFWDRQNLEELGDTPRFDGGDVDVKYVASGAAVAAGNWHDDVRIFDATRHTLINRDTCRGGMGRELSATPDGKRLVTARRRVLVWDTASGERLTPSGTHNSIVLSLGLVGKERLISGGRDACSIWERSTGRHLHKLKQESPAIPNAFLAASHDGKRVATGDWTNLAYLWHPDSGEADKWIRFHASMPDDVWDTGVVCGLAFSTDDKLLATGGQDGVVHVLDIAAGKTVARIDVAPTHREREMLEQLQRLAGRENVGSRGTHRVQRVKFSPDGRWLGFGTMFGDIELINTATWKRQVIIPDSACLFSAPFDFDPRGRGIVVPGIAEKPPTERKGIDDETATLRLWDVAGKRAIWTSKPTKGFACIGCSPNGKLVATSGFSDDNAIRLWSADNGQEVGVLKGHTDCPRALAFSPDGAILYSASQDTTILAWDLTPFQRKVK